MPGTLYLGPDTSYATTHKSDILNPAIYLNPRAHGQVATGSFIYNIYVSSLFNTLSITSASIRLYCGPTSNMVFPSWFANSQQIGPSWTWGPTGLLNPCYPLPPVANYTWDAVSDAPTHTPPISTPLIWTPGADCPVLGKPFSLIATLEYWVDGVKYTIGSGQAAKDPCAAVLCSLGF